MASDCARNVPWVNNNPNDSNSCDWSCDCEAENRISENANSHWTGTLCDTCGIVCLNGGRVGIISLHSKCVADLADLVRTFITGSLHQNP